MDQESTYTLTQLNEHGHVVNTITGLDELAATTLANVLNTGDAYTSDRPWTCQIVRELTREEHLAAAVDKWIGERASVSSAAEIVACLRRVADQLASLGDLPVGTSILDVSVLVTSSCDEAAVRMARVDQLADACGLDAHLPSSGHYVAGGLNSLRFVTIVDPPEPASDPIPDQLAPTPEPVDGEALAPGPVVHKAAEFWKGDEPGSCGASCACGTTFDGFDTLGEASDLVDRHIEVENATAEAGAVAPQPIAPERVDEILAELNRLTGDGANWWDWIEDQPELDTDATADADTAELHLVDGTVLAWRGEPTVWKRATDRPVAS